MVDALQALARSARWEGRLLAVAAAAELSAADVLAPADRARLIGPLAADADAQVRAAATSDVELARQAATRPATRRRGRPARPPSRPDPRCPTAPRPRSCRCPGRRAGEGHAG
jgi:hypothetical protein